MTDISDLTDLSTLQGHEVGYVWTDPRTSLTYTFAVGRLEEAIKRLDLEVVEIPVLAAHAALVREKRGLEEHRLARLRRLRVFPPIILAEWADGSHLTLDGNHRYLVAYERGDQWIKTVIVKQEVWSKFVIDISFDDRKPKYSGL